MTKRATRRPAGFTKPPHWSDAAPPAPGPAADDGEDLSPTRYGDWVRKGIAVDF
jgi:hypothetical protein